MQAFGALYVQFSAVLTEGNRGELAATEGSGC